MQINGKGGNAVTFFGYTQRAFRGDGKGGGLRNENKKGIKQWNL
jgi:hypothetical protein